MSSWIGRDKEGHYILVHGTIQQGEITLTNTYALNTGASMFLKLKLPKFKAQIKTNTW